MKVSCQACGAKYTIADEKVRGRKVKIRCKSCGTPIVVDGQSSQPPEGQASAASPASAAPTASAAGAGPSWSVNLSDTDQRTMTTQEIIDGWKAGFVTSDAFVWKDGMGDWLAILDSELKELLPAPAPAAAAGTPFGPTIVTSQPAAAPAPQARLAGGGRAGVDLFDATEGGGPEEDDVATSAPHLPMAGTSAYDDKMTGARNENSVLFSLDSLKGGLTGGPEKKSSPKKKSAPSNEDPFAMGGADLGAGANPLFSLNANQALLTAPAPPEPPPPRFDASGAPAKPMNKLLVYGGAAGGALVLLLVGLLLGRSGRSDEASPEDSAKAASSAVSEKKEETKAEEKKEEPKAEETKAEEKKDAPAPSASASAEPVAKGPAPTPAPGSGSGSGSKSPGTGSGSGTSKSEPKKEEVVGTAPFSVSAAQVALTQAASNSAGCAKPGGPTGSGKATVTFAPSGRVTTANVSTAPFAGTAVGGCVAGQFRKARVPAFNGNAVTVSKSFHIK